MTFVRSAGWLALAGLLLLGAAPAGTTTPTAESALAELKAGNTRHATHKYAHPHQTASRMTSLAGGQHPHAIVLSCADSRVPPEIVFDRGLGDLFTVRVAGNIAGDAEIASIEYAVEHLHVPLLVVLGHESCGAVGAAIEGGEAPGHLGTLVTAIQPSVEKARAMPGDMTANAVRMNVAAVVAALRSSHPILAEHVADGSLQVVGGVYSLKTGKVSWQPDTP
jgi:carbonic anhydrase